MIERNQNKICYLILAYNDCENLKRLITRLNEAADFYIHIDKKTEITPFKDALKEFNNVFFIEKREKIYWGGFSIVQAELNLVTAALNSGEDYLRYILLSGADYPIVPAKKIHQFFETHQQTEFIRGINLDTLENKELFGIHIDYYQKHDYPLFNRTDTFFFKAYRAGTNRVLRKFKLSPQVRHKKFDLYQGSQWWALTRGCLIELLEMYNQNPEEYKNFKIGTFAPDEKFFHTLFFNSSYKNKNQIGGVDTPIHMEDRTMTSRLANLHIIDESMTKWFCESDYSQIIKSDKLFVRKVKTGYSSKLLDAIDKNILFKGE